MIKQQRREWLQATSTRLRALSLSWMLVSALSCGADRSGGPQASSVQVTPVVSPPVSAEPMATFVDPLPEPEELEGVDFYKDDGPRRVHKLKVAFDYHVRPSLVGDPSNYVDPYVSMDGSSGLLVDHSPPGDGIQLRFYRIDTGEMVEEVNVIADPPCPNLDSKCDHRAIRKTAARANRLLTRHRWEQFRRWSPLPYLPETEWCDGLDLNRHVQVLGYEVHFTAPHLRIVRQRDRTVLVDRDFDWEVEQRRDAGTCTRSNPPDLVMGGINPERRAMFLYVQSCKHSACGGQLWVHFFHLPSSLAR